MNQESCIIDESRIMYYSGYVLMRIKNSDSDSDDDDDDDENRTIIHW